ncbi:MAG: arylsulfatase [Akkermansiaceae bacterium]
MRRVLSFLILAPLAFAKPQPNVVVFLSDDQGWGDLSHSGNRDLKTPNIDSLARDGASFEAFSVCPVCSPTRAEFLTGRYHTRSGVWATSSGGERMDLDETTIADLFQEAGYRTGAFGKWHNGMQFPYHPNGRGFDTFYGFCSGHWGDYFDPMLEKNGVIVKGEGFCIDDFTNQAMAFMKDSHQSGKPFFAYLPYNTPHSPMQVPESDWARFKDKPMAMGVENNHTRCALAMCENLDMNVGRVLAMLDELKITEETIVVWFHDNGPNGKRWNGGLRGHKGSVDEGGCRSPLFVRWPGQIAKGTEVANIASARDLLPTLCELAGVPMTSPNPLDGRSVVPLLKNPGVPWADRIHVNYWSGKLSARSQTHMLDQKGQLYDMVADRGQKVAIENAAVKKELTDVLNSFRSEHLVNFGKGHDNRPFVIAHPGNPHTQLPARDAVATGKIKRSSIHPNDSYFYNWTRTEDQIVWKAESADSGTFAVKLFYASKSAGAKCRLSFEGSSLEFTIPAAHDVPEQGKDLDRSPRTESYTKDWKALDLGEIKLQEGEGSLVLEALEIPGEEALELRLITLKKVR